MADYKFKHRVKAAEGIDKAKKKESSYKKKMAKKMKKDVNYLFKSPEQEIKRIRNSINY